MGRTTIATLRDRVERLNARLGTDLQLRAWSNGDHSVYRLDKEDGTHLNPRGATASEMEFFIDGLFAMTNNKDLLGSYSNQRDDMTLVLH